MVGMHVEQALADRLELVRRRDLGDQDCVRRRVGGGGQIVDVPGRIDAVDADDHFARPKPARRHGSHHLLAGCRLAIGRDRILKVEYDGVGRQGPGLLDRPGVRARHIEDAAARADGH